jgi:hypothetical protein
MEEFSGEREPVLFCWSGGKDSALAPYALLSRVLRVQIS